MASGIGLALPLAVPVADARPALAALVARFGDVGQERQLTGALHTTCDLILVAAAGAGDPPRADLPALGDELAQRGDVLVVDLLDLVLAEQARLAAAAAWTALLVSPSYG